jgi:hypothetical protein
MEMSMKQIDEDGVIVKNVDMSMRERREPDMVEKDQYVKGETPTSDAFEVGVLDNCSSTHAARTAGGSAT